MLRRATEIDQMLEAVCAARSAAGVGRFDAWNRPARSNDSVLFSCSASWSTLSLSARSNNYSPQHQTLRRRGTAPPFPRPIDLTRGHPGELSMFRKGLSLKALDDSRYDTFIGAQSIIRVSFYADCIEIIHDLDKRTLLCCAEIEALDLKFEAHYGR